MSYSHLRDDTRNCLPYLPSLHFFVWEMVVDLTPQLIDKINCPKIISGAEELSE